MNINEIYFQLSDVSLPASFEVSPNEIDLVVTKLGKKLQKKLGRTNIRFSKDPNKNKIWAYWKSNRV